MKQIMEFIGWVCFVFTAFVLGRTQKQKQNAEHIANTLQTRADTDREVNEISDDEVKKELRDWVR